MEFDKENVKKIKEDPCSKELIYEEIVTKGSEEQKIAVLKELNKAMKKQHVLLFRTFAAYGEVIHFVLPSKERQVVEKMTKDENETVAKLAQSILDWQRARDHYKRFGGSESITMESYLKRAYKSLKEGKLQPVPTCIELGFLEKFV